MEIDGYLQSLIVEGVSDLHFKVDRPPLRRIFGTLSAVDAPPLTAQHTEALAQYLLGPARWKTMENEKELDTSFSMPGFARLRVNIFRQRSSLSIVLRVIPCSIPTLAQLGVPDVVEKIAQSTRGLVLVTGMSGAGKSSTLAGMIHHINTTLPRHIITIEDPIEFLHQDHVSSIEQREIGVDTTDFSHALHASLRQDPDVILVGELRNADSMEIALRAAETGHLVLSTVHTTDAKETIGRFVDAFPAHQHRQVRIQLAFNLQAVISQRLLKRIDQQGQVLASEIMVVNAAIRSYILDPERVGDIAENIAKGREHYGMQTFDQSIMELYKKGLISIDEAVANATSPNDFKLRLQQN